MSKSRGKTRWNLIVILIIAGALSYAGFRYLYPPQPADIFIIDPVINLEYGDTTVTGELRKGVPVGQDGEFLLILPDSRVIVLDVAGLDHLIGSLVTVSGYLSPTVDRSLPMYMTVKSLTLQE